MANPLYLLGKKPASNYRQSVTTPLVFVLSIEFITKRARFYFKKLLSNVLFRSVPFPPP